jgi:glucose/arabinose dehydrogenase
MLPKEEHHGWKFIAFGPDGKLYIPVGAPCNVCEPEDSLHACMLRMNADGSQLEVFAKGIRNTVGFDWDPKSKNLWFTDNGRDLLGDDLPPDEVNYAPHKGMHFGFPYCHAGIILDPKFGKEKSCAQFVAPVFTIGAHSAPLGLRFYSGKQFPSSYSNSIFIAEHGSWNRTEPTGYAIINVQHQGANAQPAKTSASGWLQNGAAWGRPVDVQPLSDGSLLVSDDEQNCIYHIYYQK